MVEAEITEKVSVMFNKEIREAQPDVQDEIKRRLMSMKCEYAVKSEIYSMANRYTKEQFICGVLSMDISENMKYGRCGKSCVNSIKTSLLGENYGRNNFYQGGFST